MARRLTYSSKARDDLIKVRLWLTQPGSGITARRRLAAIRNSINGLKERPCLHPIVDHVGVRELPLSGGYRAIYEVRDDTGRNDTAGDVTVLRVYGPKQGRDRV